MRGPSAAIATRRARIAYLEAKLGQPPKTPEKSSVPPFEFSQIAVLTKDPVRSGKLLSPLLNDSCGFDEPRREEAVKARTARIVACGGVLLGSNQYVAYATLALGSALAAFMYPHTLTGIFASRSAHTIRKTAMLLPLYTLMLGLLALLGYAGLAANLKLESNNDVVPALFHALFPSWFAGFAFAAIAIGALVPAAVMSIGSANLFTRNFWKAYVDPEINPAGEAKVAKIASLVVKLGALLFILYLPTRFALNLQLLGGLWILQTLPTVLASLYFRWFAAPALFVGWAVGMAGGTYMAWSDGFKPLHALTIGDTSFTAYVGIIALVANFVGAVVASLVMIPWRRR
jgi:solute:Na+ symporter, SSS family